MHSRPLWTAPYRLGVGIALVAALLAPGDADGVSIVKLFRYEAPPSGFYGSYGGDLGITLGEVKDETFAPTPGWLGFIELKETRVETIQASTELFLRDTGLAARSPAGPPYRLDVTIRRYRLTDQTVGYRDARLRGEVFLEFTISRDGELVTTVLACGNAEHLFTKTSLAKKVKRFGAVHRAAVDDAFVKLTQSEGFGVLFGPGWATGTMVRPLDPEWTIGRIDSLTAYGPGAQAADLSSLLRVGVGDAAVSRIVIGDFAYLHEDYLEYLAELEKDPDDTDEEDEEEAALASRWLPDLLREILTAYYRHEPFPTSSDGEATEADIVVSGDVFKLDPKGGKQTLHADITFSRGDADEPLHTLHVHWIFGSASAAWSPLASIFEAGADSKRLREGGGVNSETETFWVGYHGGTLVMMADELAHNLARALVTTLGPKTEPAASSVEVVFDGFSTSDIAAADGT